MGPCLDGEHIKRPEEQNHLDLSSELADDVFDKSSDAANSAER